MAYSYNTTTKKVTVTATSTARALHDDIQSTFAGSTYMQYLIPNSGKIKDALYQFENGWTFLDSTSVNYMTTGGWITSDGNDKWTNIQAISGDTFTGIQTYIGQNGTVTNAVATGLPNQLLKVRNSGSDIASQSYTVYQRTQGKRYSQFTTTASSGGVDSIPLSISTDPLITISDGTLGAYSDLSITWASRQRSAFDGTSVQKYTLNGSHTNVVTTFTVNETIDASVPSSGKFAVGNSITQEIISYTGKGTNTFTGCTRAQDGTTAASYASGASLNTNVQTYVTTIKTTNSARRLTEAYNWIQYKLRSGSDIDSLAGGHIGQLTNALVSMPSSSSMTTSQGVWVEGFAAADANVITYTDNSNNTHTAPLSIAVTVNFDATVTSAGGQVAVFALDSTGYTDSTYTPAHISSTIINSAASGTSVSTSLTYSADIPVRVVVRAPGLQQYSLYTTITSAGLTVSAQNPSDSAY